MQPCRDLSPAIEAGLYRRSMGMLASLQPRMFGQVSEVDFVGQMLPASLLIGTIARLSACGLRAGQLAAKGKLIEESQSLVTQAVKISQRTAACCAHAPNISRTKYKTWPHTRGESESFFGRGGIPHRGLLQSLDLYCMASHVQSNSVYWAHEAPQILHSQCPRCPVRVLVRDR